MPPCACCPPTQPHRALSRRRALFSALAGTSLACMGFAANLAAPRVAHAAAGLPPTTLSPDQALTALMEGHRRFLSDAAPIGLPNTARRAELATGQAPFAAILGCADSRATPEVLFQAGLGELFVVRNAGNLADIGAIGSLEYAVSVLGVPLIMVLGHERCGAAGAAAAMAQQDLVLPAPLREMLLPMLPSALAAVRAGGDAVEGTIRHNITRNVTRLVTDSAVLSAAVAAGRLRVVGAYYALEDQKVTASA